MCARQRATKTANVFEVESMYMKGFQIRAAALSEEILFIINADMMLILIVIQSTLSEVVRTIM